MFCADMGGALADGTMFLHLDWDDDAKIHLHKGKVNGDCLNCERGIRTWPFEQTESSAFPVNLRGSDSSAGYDDGLQHLSASIVSYYMINGSQSILAYKRKPSICEIRHR